MCTMQIRNGENSSMWKQQRYQNPANCVTLVMELDNPITQYNAKCQQFEAIDRLLINAVPSYKPLLMCAFYNIIGNFTLQYVCKNIVTQIIHYKQKHLRNV